MVVNGITEKGALNLAGCPLYKIIQDTPVENVAAEVRAAIFTQDEDVCARDSLTGETYLHLISKHVEKFSDARALPAYYALLYKGTDPSAQTNDKQETVLHKLVRTSGSHKLIIATLRYGVDVNLTDCQGKTPLDILQNDKPDGWEENLVWYNKLSPGLYCSVMPQPSPQSSTLDLTLIEKLLKSWCKVCVHVNGKDLSLLAYAQMRAKDAPLASLLKKYSFTNGFVHATLAGITSEMRKIYKEAKKKIDVDTMDHSYQLTLSHPKAPRPLVIAAWEQENFEVIDQLLKFDADVCNSYTSEDPDVNPSKPMFYQTLLGKPRINSLNIILRILENGDLRCKTERATTFLHEAVTHNLPPAFVRKLFEYNVPLEERNADGLTARDFALKTGNQALVQVMDDCVLDLANSGQTKQLEYLTLHSYDLSQVRTADGRSLNDMMNQGQLSSKTCKFLKSIPQLQNRMFAIWKAVCREDMVTLKQMIYDKEYKTAIYSRDRGGRSILLHAIRKLNRPMIRLIVKKHPKLVEYFDNVMFTCLHYAYLMFEDNAQEVAQFLQDNGASLDWCCTGGRSAYFYQKGMMDEGGFKAMRAAIRTLGWEITPNKDNILEALQVAVQAGDITQVKKFQNELRWYCGFDMLGCLLFNAVDANQSEMCLYLLKNGAPIDVTKQYESCSPDNPMCAMLECYHPETSLIDRARSQGLSKVVEVIESMSRS